MDNFNSCPFYFSKQDFVYVLSIILTSLNVISERVLDIIEESISIIIL